MRKCYELKLQMKGPLLSHSSEATQFGIDSAMQRYRDKPALNGSLLQGNIREMIRSLSSFHDAQDKEDEGIDPSKDIDKYLNKWFGKMTGGAGDANPVEERSSVSFDLFWQLTDELLVPPYSQTRTRIAISKSGTVETGAMQLIEDCIPLGKIATFCGNINAKFDNDDEAELFEFWLHAVFNYLLAVGSNKGIGFGQIDSIKLQTILNSPQSVSDVDFGSSSNIGMQFSFNQPFCLGALRTPDSNRIESTDIIYGNVLKAVIANACESEEEKKELQIDALGFDHAHYCGKSNEPLIPAIPMSIAMKHKSNGEKSFLDLLNLNTQSVNDISEKNGLLKLATDWKEDYRDVVSEVVGKGVINPPSRILLVRTAINSATGVSEESQLFSVECVEPKDHYWSTNIKLGKIAVEDRQRVLSKLIEVMSRGLFDVGKTRARLTDITLYSDSQEFIGTPKSSFKETIKGDVLSLTLLTDARLFPEALCEFDVCKLYQQYFKTMSDNALILCENQYFAQQSIKGSAYYHHRFQGGPDKNYYPQWVTLTGSTFLLKVEDADKANALLNDWLANGLPASPGISGAADWRNTQYLPEHGFGRIALNLGQSLLGGDGASE